MDGVILGVNNGSVFVTFRFWNTFWKTQKGQQPSTFLELQAWFHTNFK